MIKSNSRKDKKGQIAVFVIIAIVIVVGIVAFFVLKDNFITPSVSAEIVPIQEYYLSCIEGHVEDGLSIMGSQAGYIELPAFEAGTRTGRRVNGRRHPDHGRTPAIQCTTRAAAPAPPRVEPARRRGLGAGFPRGLCHSGR